MLYGNTAAECLRGASRLHVRPRVSVLASVPFADISTLYHLLGSFELNRGEETYAQDGLHLALEVFPEDVEALALALRDATRGAGVVLPGATPGVRSGEY